MFTIILQMSPVDQLTNLGVAGIMGAMWLWERRTSRVREEQIDEAHARIMADRVMLDELMEVVQRNTEAMVRLSQIHTISKTDHEHEKAIYISVDGCHEHDVPGVQPR